MSLFKDIQRQYAIKYCVTFRKSVLCNTGNNVFTLLLNNDPNTEHKKEGKYHTHEITLHECNVMICCLDMVVTLKVEPIRIDKESNQVILIMEWESLNSYRFLSLLTTSGTMS